MSQLSEFLTPKQLEQLSECLEWIIFAGKGELSISVVNGHVYQISKTIYEKLEYDKSGDVTQIHTLPHRT